MRVQEVTFSVYGAGILTAACMAVKEHSVVMALVTVAMLAFVVVYLHLAYKNQVG